MGVANDVLSPIIVGAAGLGSSAISNGVGASNTNKTNEMSMQVAQMNNEFNERMLEKQMKYNAEQAQIGRDYATDMWNKQNAYNDPSAQRERLEQAGYNPYMYTGANNAASISSISSASSTGASAAANPQLSTFRPDFSTVAGSIEAGMNLYEQVKNNKVQRREGEARANQLNIENKYIAAKRVAEINNMIQNTSNQKTKQKLDQIQASMMPEMLNAELDVKRQTYENMKATFKGIQIQNAYDSAVLNNYPERFKMEMAVQSSRVALQLAQGQLSKKQAVTELMKQAEASARAAGQRISNDIVKRTAEDLVRQAGYTTLKLRNNIGPEGLYGIPNVLQSVGTSLFEGTQYLFSRFNR